MIPLVLSDSSTGSTDERDTYRRRHESACVGTWPDDVTKRDDDTQTHRHTYTGVRQRQLNGDARKRIIDDH